MSLKIAANLSLPNEAVTQTFAILAKRGVGKTYTASVLVEEMLKNHLPVVVIDPIGVWWGLRSSADGKREGFPIIIAGGEHADVPIEPESGEILANLVVDQRVSLVIDLSNFRKGQQTRFMTDFAETLYHRNRAALHVIVDEADAFAPQRVMKGQERMLGAMEDLVRRGRARGIGLTLISQRPAVLHKDVLTQVEVLVALRLIAPQDRNAIDEWIKVHGEPGQREELMQSLPSLPIGTAWFWSPGWLDIFKKVEVRKRETLDSSSTPKIGQEIAAKKLAPVDLQELRKKLATTIEKAEQDNPKLLRRRIIELEKQLSSQPVKEVEKPYPVPVITEDDLTKLSNLLEPVTDLMRAIINRLPTETTQPSRIVYDEPRPQKFSPMAKLDDSEVKITGGAQRMLDVLGSRYPMTFTKSQLAALSKMSPRSGTFGTYMSKLRSEGLIAQDGDQISLTESGQQHIGDISAVPQTPEEVVAMWRGNLTGGARRMFDVLVESYPAGISREGLGEATDMSARSGTFGTYLSTLRRNGLIEVNGNEIQASDSLFAGARVTQ